MVQPSPPPPSPTPTNHDDVIGEIPMSRPHHEPGRALELTAEQVRRAGLAAPSSPAIVAGGRTVTHAQLSSMAGTAAAELARRGVLAGDRVVVLAHRAPETIATFLACLATGVCYVPVDPDLPPAAMDRITRMSEARSTFDAVRHGLGPGGTSDVGPEWPTDGASSELPAYLLFTSGSTGSPRGVLISQANLASYVTIARDLYELTAADRSLQVASLGFDWSVSEIFPTLASGGAVVLRSADALGSARDLLKELREQRVTTVQLPTAVWHALTPGLITEPDGLPASLRHVTIGAEQASWDTVRAWDRRFGDSNVRLVNSYGPTECTVEATQVDLSGPRAGGPFERRARVSVGKPLPGARVHVLDEDGRRCPVGATGQVFIAGWGVGLGYFRDAAATAAAFVPDHITGQGTMYATGDLGAWNADGELEYVGRIDYQVKIAGVRVEPEGIERHLTEHPAVREAAVVPDPSRSRLIAFAVVTSGVGESELRGWCSEQLPAAEVPAQVTILDELPRTINDKVDRGRLAELAAARPRQQTPDARDAGGLGSGGRAGVLEEVIARVWQDVLGHSEVGLDDDFFDLGGFSLQAVRIAAGLAREGVEVSARDVLTSRTIRALARSASVDSHPSAGGRA